MLLFCLGAGPQQFRAPLCSAFPGLTSPFSCPSRLQLAVSKQSPCLVTGYPEAGDEPLWSSDSCLRNKQSQEVKRFHKEPRLDAPCFKDSCPACEADLQRTLSWDTKADVPLAVNPMQIECSQSPCLCVFLSLSALAVFSADSDRCDAEFAPASPPPDHRQDVPEAPRANAQISCCSRALQGEGKSKQRGRGAIRVKNGRTVIASMDGEDIISFSVL